MQYQQCNVGAGTNCTKSTQYQSMKDLNYLITILQAINMVSVIFTYAFLYLIGSIQYVKFSPATAQWWHLNPSTYNILILKLSILNRRGVRCQHWAVAWENFTCCNQSKLEIELTRDQTSPPRVPAIWGHWIWFDRNLKIVVKFFFR
jgi:hypothetical protein